jgi:hypothetical protein
MRRFCSLMLALALLLGGCNAAPGLRPARAVDLAMAHPEVAAWYKAHMIPHIIGGPGGTDERRWRNYQPAVTVDRVTEGLVVRLHARLGPTPRDVEVLMDGEKGRVLSIRKR